jgi:hypothetical protein
MISARRVTMIRDRQTAPGTWTIADEDHRDLGRITHAQGFGFFIYAPRGTRLSGVAFGPYETLAEAVQKVAEHTKAACVLSGMADAVKGTADVRPPRPAR